MKAAERKAPVGVEAHMEGDIIENMATVAMRDITEVTTEVIMVVMMENIPKREEEVAG